MAAKQSPVINLQTDFFKDRRVDIIAQRAGLDLEVAQIRLIKLWCWCRDEGTKFAVGGDRPGWVVPDSVVRGFLGPNGPEALLADGCEELALGIRTEDGRIYLAGSERTVRNLLSAGAKARKGGQARSALAGRLAGRYQPVNQPQTSQPPATDQPGHQPQASSKLAPASSVPCTDQNTHTPARARDPYVPERHPDAGRVADRVWTYAAVKHGELRASGLDPTTPPWPATHGSSNPGWLALLDRATEMLAEMPATDAEARGKHRVDVSAAEAKSRGTLRWFNALAMFVSDSFARGCAMSVESAGRRADRGGSPRDPQRDEIRTTIKPL